MLSVACQGFSSLSAIFAVRASCRLPQLRCWVAPSSKAVCPAGPATPLLLPPLLGKPTACSTWPLFLSNFAGASPSKMLRASRRRPFRPLAQTLSVCAVAKPPKTAPVGGASVQGLRPLAFILRISLVTGRAGPGPGGRLPLAQAGGLCRRPGAWGPPSVVPSKPSGAHAPDRLRGHPPLPLVAPGPWWFRDSKPGARIWVGGEWQRWWPD